MNKSIVYFIFAFILIFALSLFINPVTYDEGLAYLGAKNVLQGNTPYKDFWTIYAPGQFYLNAGILAVFGDFVISLRIFTGLIIFAIGLIINKLITQFTTKEVILPGILSTILLFSINFYGRAIPTAILLTLLLIFLISKYIKEKNIKFLIFAGINTSVIALFRQDFGAYAGISIFFFFIYYSFVLEKEDKFRTISKNLGIFSSSLIISFIPIAAHFIYHSGFDNVYNQLFYFPMNIFPKFREIDYGLDALVSTKYGIMVTLTAIYYNVVLGVKFSFLISIFSKKLNRSFNFISFQYVLLTFLIFMISFQSATREDLEHIIPVTIFIIFLLYYEILKNKNDTNIRYINIFFLAILMLLPILNIAKAAKEIKNNTFEMEFATSLRFIPINESENKDLRIILQKLDFSTLPDEKIYVCNTKHDKIYINDIMIYVYTNKMPSSSVYELHPGFATDQAGQTIIIDDLIKSSNRILIQVDLPIVEEGNLSSVSSNIFLLDNHIQNNYYNLYSKGKYKMSIRR